MLLPEKNVVSKSQTRALFTDYSSGPRTGEYVTRPTTALRLRTSGGAHAVFDLRHAAFKNK